MAQQERQGTIHFPSDGLRLEGVLHLPPGRGPYSTVAVCHPHPLYGGDMENAVVTAVCRALVSRGLAALRFNFRGTGDSQGVHAGGEGEVRDALAALEYLERSADADPARLALAGYSFGASVALRAALRSPLVLAVAAIACPVQALHDTQLQRLDMPKLLLVGDRDQFLPVGELRRAAEQLPGPTLVHVLPGADHFLRGHEETVAERVAQFLARALQG